MILLFGVRVEKGLIQLSLVSNSGWCRFLVTFRVNALLSLEFTVGVPVEST